MFFRCFKSLSPIGPGRPTKTASTRDYFLVAWMDTSPHHPGSKETAGIQAMYSKPRATNIRPYSSLVAYQVLHEQFVPFQVLLHACILLWLVLHLSSLLDSWIPKRSGVFGLHHLFCDPQPVQGTVQLRQVATKAMLGSLIASISWWRMTNGNKSVKRQ